MFIIDYILSFFAQPVIGKPVEVDPVTEEVQPEESEVVSKPRKKRVQVLEKMTKADLVEYGAARGVKLTMKMTKKDMIDALK